MDFADVETIPGWFWRTDVELFNWILSQQVLAGESGDLAELGCYLGRSAVLIGWHQQPGEIFTVIDLFDGPTTDSANTAENVKQYGDLSQTAFEDHYRRALGRLPIIITGNSQDITSHASHGTHRFVHIDASHLYDHVRGDIAAAKTLLNPTGVVVLDDIRASHTPGVWAAVWEAVITGGLRPIAVTEHKLYGTWGDAGAVQARLMSTRPAGVYVEQQTVLGHTLLRLWTQPTPLSRMRRVTEALTPPAVLRRFDRLNVKSRRSSTQVNHA